MGLGIWELREGEDEYDFGNVGNGGGNGSLLIETTVFEGIKFCNRNLNTSWSPEVTKVTQQAPQQVIINCVSLPSLQVIYVP